MRTIKCGFSVSLRVPLNGANYKTGSEDWWVQCFPNEQPYTHNYTTEMNGSSRYTLRRARYANCSSNSETAAHGARHPAEEPKRLTPIGLTQSIMLLSAYVFVNSIHRNPPPNAVIPGATSPSLSLDFYHNHSQQSCVMVPTLNWTSRQTMWRKYKLIARI